MIQALGTCSFSTNCKRGTAREVLSSQVWDWGLLDSESEDPGVIPAPLLK